MRNLIFSLLLLSGVAAKTQESILDLAEGYEYRLTIPFPGDTIVHIDYVDLPKEMNLNNPHRIIEDKDGTSKVYYFEQWRIMYHVWYGRRETTTISRLLNEEGRRLLWKRL